MTRTQRLAIGSCLVLGALLLVHTIGSAQKPDKVMRVLGEVSSVDATAGTLVIQTNSGPRMTVQAPKGEGKASAVGSSVVVQFNQSAAQGRVDSGLLTGVGGARRPGTVNATSIRPSTPKFCGCAGTPSDKGCTGACSGDAPEGWSCKVLSDIVYPGVCGLEQNK